MRYCGKGDGSQKYSEAMSASPAHAYLGAQKGHIHTKSGDQYG